MKTLKPVLEHAKIGAQGSFIKRQILPQVDYIPTDFYDVFMGWLFVGSI